MTDTLYTIPQNWRWVKLKDIAFHISDGSHNPPDDSGTGVPLLSAKNIYDSFLDINNANRYITEIQWKQENKRTKIEFGDVLITIVGTIGRVACVDTNLKFALQRSVAVIKPKVNSLFLMYFLQSPYIQTYIAENAKGTAQKGFYLDSLKNLPCILPPLAEQKRIVERLDSLFEKLDAAKKILQDIVDGYELRRAAILHCAFTGKLTEDFRKKNNLSLDDWQEKTLDKFIQLLSGQDLKSDKYNSLKNGIPYITGASNFDGEKILINRWTEKPTVISKKGDVLITCKGSTGKTAMANFESAHIARQVMALRVSEKAYNFFVHYFLQSKYEELKKCERGLIPGISRQDILNLEINLPPLEEQKEISRRLDSLIGKENQTKEIAENLLSEIEKLKKTILSRAFRGELGTNDPSENAVENFEIERE